MNIPCGELTKMLPPMIMPIIAIIILLYVYCTVKNDKGGIDKNGQK